jgi:small subunit ribosomal protein S6
MTSPAPTYDLVLLLDPQAEQAVREKLVADTRASIDAQGELLRHDEWGERALSYPIDRRTSARYHLMQFHAGSAELLSGLDRTLRLADEVLRFRIIKLAPGVPSAPDMSAAPAPPRQSSEEPAQAPAAEAPAPAAEPAPAEPDVQPGDVDEAAATVAEPS